MFGYTQWVTGIARRSNAIARRRARAVRVGVVVGGLLIAAPGTIRAGATATPAYNDLVTAYNEVAGRTGGAALAGDLNGLTLLPGLYSAAAAVANTGTRTLAGGGD